MTKQTDSIIIVWLWAHFASQYIYIYLLPEFCYYKSHSVQLFHLSVDKCKLLVVMKEVTKVFSTVGFSVVPFSTYKCQ